MIKIACACGKVIKVKDEHAGRTLKCPGCGAGLTVPESGIGIEGRLAALEADNEFLAARLRRASISGAMGIALGLLAAGLAGYAVLTRPALRSVGELGVVAGETVVASEFVAGKLSLYDPGNPNKQAVLEMGRFGPELRLNDASGNPRITFGMGEKSPEIQILDEQGNRLVGLSAQKDYSWLSFYDSTGDARITLGGSRPDAPYELRIGGTKSGSEVSLGMFGAAPSLVLAGADGSAGQIQMGLLSGKPEGWPVRAFFDVFDENEEIHRLLPLLMGD